MTVLTARLTQPYSDERKKQLRQSVEGMATWAGTGPEGAVCSQCEHYKTISKAGHALRDKERPCQKFKRMTGVKGDKKIPRKTPACRFFLPVDKAA